VSDKDREIIRFNTEIIKLLTFLFTATGGGVTTLIISGISTAREAIITAFGMVFVLVIGILGLVWYRNTKNLLR
jgi:hypothetical protein